MDIVALEQWFDREGAEPIVKHPDRKLSLSSRVLRTRWRDAPTVGVVASDGAKRMINAVLDGMAWFDAVRAEADSGVHVVIGSATADAPSLDEPLAAIGTLVSEMETGPRVHVWIVTPDGDVIEIPSVAATFRSRRVENWATMLTAAIDLPVTGVTRKLVEAVAHPSFALYPKLSSIAGAQPWQLRLDGLDIGRAGVASAVLHLSSADAPPSREPRLTWQKIVGTSDVPLDACGIDEFTAIIRRLIAAWSDGAPHGTVLGHGQAEHALEAHVLSGRTRLVSSEGSLRLAVEARDRVLGAAQFPTLWGGGSTAPTRYLDALLQDDHHRPWAVELKDQNSGGNGSYLRHGIAQAVLYRHFIRSAAALDNWFRANYLEREQCQAAVAFPTAVPKAQGIIASHRAVAGHFGVRVIEFPRPGTSP